MKWETTQITGADNIRPRSLSYCICLSHALSSGSICCCRLFSLIWIVDYRPSEQSEHTALYSISPACFTVGSVLYWPQNIKVLDFNVKRLSLFKKGYFCKVSPSFGQMWNLTCYDPAPPLQDKWLKRSPGMSMLPALLVAVSCYHVYPRHATQASCVSPI